MDRLIEKGTKLLLFFCLLCLAGRAFSAIKSPGPLTVKGREIVKLNKDINLINNRIFKLNSRIVSLEDNLGEKNKSYLGVIKTKRDTEYEIFKLKTDLSAISEDVRNRKNEVRKNLSFLMVNSLYKNEGPADILGRRILARKLAQKLSKLKVLQEVNDVSLHRLRSVEKKLATLQKLETETVGMIHDLEKRKKGLAENYLKELRKKESLEDKISKLKVSAYKERNRSLIDRPEGQKGINGIDMRFASPLARYIGLDYKSKGITYKFDKVQPVHATMDGRIIYRGSLSTYGNVVMIDHGNDTRSVILGKFLPKVKKGAKIKIGDILGHTKKDQSGTGKVYFEVRKKNQAQNTILLMDKKFLTGNNLI